MEGVSHLNVGCFAGGRRRQKMGIFKKSARVSLQQSASSLLFWTTKSKPSKDIPLGIVATPSNGKNTPHLVCGLP